VEDHNRKPFSCKEKNTISGIFLMILIQDMGYRQKAWAKGMGQRAWGIGHGALC
jgi:hypothetical protein